MGMYGAPRLELDCSVAGPSLTKQSFAGDTDINKIIAKFEKTGMIEHVNRRQPFYGDVSEYRGYQESLEMVREAQELFNNMSANIRERFENDPVKMIEFLDNPANLQEAIDLGMVLPDPRRGQGSPENVPQGGQSGQVEGTKA